jgi:hypothetical protein
VVDYRTKTMNQHSPILVLYAHEWRSMNRLAAKNEAWAKQQIDGLWDAYNDQPLPCVCGKDCDWPPFTQIMEQRDDASRLLAVPLCKVCAKLPAIVRYNRVASSEGYFKQSRRFNFNFGSPRH